MVKGVTALRQRFGAPDARALQSLGAAGRPELRGARCAGPPPAPGPCCHAGELARQHRSASPRRGTATSPARGRGSPQVPTQRFRSAEQVRSPGTRGPGMEPRGARCAGPPPAPADPRCPAGELTRQHRSASPRRGASTSNARVRGSPRGPPQGFRSAEQVRSPGTRGPGIEPRGVRCAGPPPAPGPCCYAGELARQHRSASPDTEPQPLPRAVEVRRRPDTALPQRGRAPAGPCCTRRSRPPAPKRQPQTRKPQPLPRAVEVRRGARHSVSAARSRFGAPGTRGPGIEPRGARCAGPPPTPAGPCCHAGELARQHRSASPRRGTATSPARGRGSPQGPTQRFRSAEQVRSPGTRGPGIKPRGVRCAGPPPAPADPRCHAEILAGSTEEPPTASCSGLLGSRHAGALQNLSAGTSWARPPSPQLRMCIGTAILSAESGRVVKDGG